MLTQLKAKMLLEKCVGDEIWSVELCQNEGIPTHWIEELSDTFESGFNSDQETIYVQGSVTNQYRGCRDLDLAFKLGEYLGIDSQFVTSTSFSPLAKVQAIKEAVEEG